MSATARTACAPSATPFERRLAGRRLNIGEHQPRAFRGEPEGDRLADACADPCNDGSLVRQSHSAGWALTFESGAGARSRLVITLSIIPYSTACSGLMM